MFKQMYQKRVKIVILLILGLVLWALLGQTENVSLSALVSDAIFVCSIIFFLTGIMEIAINTGFFNGLLFGTKCLYRLVRQKLGPSREVMDEYAQYASTRVKFYDAPSLLVISAALAAASVLVYTVSQR